MNHENNVFNVSLKATFHCLIGCSIGEILGMMIGAHFNIHDFAAVALSIFLAFIFGYSFTLVPLLKHLTPKKALKTTFASDTVSITVMEISDNLIMFLIPGAMAAGLFTFLFWGSLATSLFIAFLGAFPVNYYLIKKGKSHAMAHGGH